MDIDICKQLVAWEILGGINFLFRKGASQVGKTKRISAGFRTKLIDLLKIYFFIGGMPEAVALGRSGSTDGTKNPGRNIRAYAMDFSRYATKRQSGRPSPRQVLRGNLPAKTNALSILKSLKTPRLVIMPSRFNGWLTRSRASRF